jgi:hypothetical protein
MNGDLIVYLGWNLYEQTFLILQNCNMKFFFIYVDFWCHQNSIIVSYNVEMVEKDSFELQISFMIYLFLNGR